MSHKEISEKKIVFASLIATRKNYVLVRVFVFAPRSCRWIQNGVWATTDVDYKGKTLVVFVIFSFDATIA